MAKEKVKKETTRKKKAPSNTTPAGYVSVPKFAEKVGVSRQRILKAIETGVLKASVKVDNSTKRKLYKIHENKGMTDRDWET